MKEWLNGSVAWIKDFFRRNGRDLLVFSGMCIVGALSFEGGMVHGLSLQSKPLVIEKVSPSAPMVAGASAENTDQSSFSVGNSSKLSSDGSGDSQKCAFVGSRNSDKYHLPSCSFAKRIKPENIVCFASEEDAKSKGYQAGCIK